MCTADSLRACLRKSEVLNFPLLNQVLHRSRYVFNGHLWINTVLVEQINGIQLESLERGIGNFSDMLRTTIHASLRTQFESEFGGNDHLVTKRREGFTD